jgi:hypothetical protein
MSRQRWQRTVAVLAGFLSVAILSFGTDHMLSPAWGALALSYRLFYGVIGGYVTARLAPYAPIHHSVILGLVGFLLSAGAAIATIPLDIGPAWYPIALALIALPTSAAGGVLFAAKA